MSEQIEVIQFNPQANWSFASTYADCPICREPLEGLCLSCATLHTKGNITCDVSRGKCLDCFHKHCIEKVTEKSQVCPVCTTPYATDVRNMDNNTDWIKLAKQTTTTTTTTTTSSN